MTLDISEKYQPQMHWLLEHLQCHSHYNVSDTCCCTGCVGDRLRKGPRVVQGVSCVVQGTPGYMENYWPAIGSYKQQTVLLHTDQKRQTFRIASK